MTITQELEQRGEAEATRGRSHLIRPLDIERLRREFRAAAPFPHVLIDPFLEHDFAREVSESYPSFEEAARMGREFDAVNEYRKIQITDSRLFPEPVRRLDQALASPGFVRDLEEITGIDGLLYDPELAGGGIHITGARGRLDVHVDFNFIPERGIYRRLNLLLYLNPTWERSWGGAVELWDEKVRTMHHAFAPRMNRCVIFETSEKSFHGVEPVTCPPEVVRKSFAVYYYTREAPASYSGEAHTTIFKARPHERLKKYVLMPAQRARELALEGRRRLRDARRALLGQPPHEDGE